MSYRSVVESYGPTHFPWNGLIDHVGGADLAAVGGAVELPWDPGQDDTTPGAGIPTAYLLDGIDDYLWAPDGPVFDFTSGYFAVVWWVRWTYNSAGGSILRPDQGTTESFGNHWAKGDTTYQGRADGGDPQDFRFDLRGGSGGSGLVSVDEMFPSIPEGSSGQLDVWRLVACEYRPDEGVMVVYLVDPATGTASMYSSARAGSYAANDSRWTVGAQDNAGTIRRFLGARYVPPVIIRTSPGPATADSVAMLEAIYAAKDDPDDGGTGPNIGTRSVTVSVGSAAATASRAGTGGRATETTVQTAATSATRTGSGGRTAAQVDVSRAAVTASRAGSAVRAVAVTVGTAAVSAARLAGSGLRTAVVTVGRAAVSVVTTSSEHRLARPSATYAVPADPTTATVPADPTDAAVPADSTTARIS